MVEKLGPRARAATAAEIAVVTLPLKNYRQVPVEPLRGKVVIDANNYYPDRDGHIAELDDEPTTTSELLQAHLPDAQVVKQTVIEFLDAIGYDTLDAGTLTEGWRFQRDTSAYVTPCAVPDTTYSGWSARPAIPAVLRDALDAARRYRDM